MTAWRDLIDGFRLGVNFAGLEFNEYTLPGVHGTDYFSTSTATIDHFADQGSQICRIPFSWERVQPTLGAALDETNLGYVQTMVTHATSRSMRTIIYPHNYGGYIISGTEYKIGTAQVTLAHFEDLWTRLANEFKSNPLVWFDLINEPVGIADVDLVTYLQAAINAIRATGAKNKILVPSSGYSGAHSWFDNLKQLEYEAITDSADNWAFTAHQYLDADNAGDDNGVSSETLGTRRLRALTDYCRQKGYKVLLGEFNGGDNNSADGSVPLKAINEAVDHLVANQDVWLGMTMWAAGDYWGGYLHNLNPSGGSNRLRFTQAMARRNKVTPYASGTIDLDFVSGAYTGVNAVTDVLDITQAGSTYKPLLNGGWEAVSANTLRVSGYGLLTEEARLVTFPSEPFGSAYFTNHDMIISGGQADLIGGTSAIKLTDTAADAVHYGSWSKNAWGSSIVDTDNLVISMFAKAGANKNIRPYLYYGSPETRSYPQPDSPSTSFPRYGDWRRVSISLANYSYTYKQIKIGMQPDGSASAGHQPDAYAGAGDDVYIWHPQMEKRVSGSGAMFPTSPVDIAGDGTEVTRAEDVVDIIGDMLTTLQGNFTFVAELDWCPDVAVALPVLTLNGSVVALRRNADYSAGGDLGATQTTAAQTDGKNAWVVPRKVGISVNRTTGEVVIGAEGVASVSSIESVPAITSAKLGPSNCFIRSIQVYPAAKTTAQMDTLLLSNFAVNPASFEVSLLTEAPVSYWDNYTAANDGTKTKLHTGTSLARLGHAAMLDNQRGTYVYQNEDPTPDIVSLILFVRTGNALALKNEITLTAMNDAASLHNIRMTDTRGLVMGYDSSASQGKLLLYGLDATYDAFTSPAAIDAHDVTGFTSSNVENIDRATDTTAFMAVSEAATSGHVVVVDVTGDTISQGTPVDFTTSSSDTITLSGGICALTSTSGFYVADKKVHYFATSGTEPIHYSSSDYFGGSAAGERRIARISDTEAIIAYETAETGGVFRAQYVKYVPDSPPDITFSDWDESTPLAASQYETDTYAWMFHLNGNDFVVQNYVTNTIEVVRWSGSAWSQLASLSVTMNNADGGFKLTSDTFVWINHSADDMYVYQFNGTDTITQIDSELNFFDFAGYPMGVYLADNKALVHTGNLSSTDKALQTVEYSGGAFSKVGNAYTLTGNYQVPIAMTENRVAILDSSNETVYCLEYSGSDWSQVGNAYNLSAAAAGRMGGCALSDTRIVVWTGSSSIQCLDWDGSDFTEQGPEKNTAASSWPRSMARLSDTKFVFHQYGGGGKMQIFNADADYGGSWTHGTPVELVGDSVKNKLRQWITPLGNRTVAIMSKEETSGNVNQHIVKADASGVLTETAQISSIGTTGMNPSCCTIPDTDGRAFLSSWSEGSTGAEIGYVRVNIDDGYTIATGGGLGDPPAPATLFDVDAGTVLDLDATSEDSTGASPTTSSVWANRVTSPADGQAQTDHDFTNTGFTWSGTAGDVTGKWVSPETGNYMLLSNPQGLLANIGRTDTATTFTIGLRVKWKNGGNRYQEIFNSKRGNDTNQHDGFYWSILNNTTMYFGNRQGGVNSSGTGSMSVSLIDGSTYNIFLSVNVSAGTTKYGAFLDGDSVALASTSGTNFTAGSNPAENVLMGINRVLNGATSFELNAEITQFYVSQTPLTDALASDVIDAWKARAGL